MLVLIICKDGKTFRIIDYGKQLVAVFGNCLLVKAFFFFIFCRELLTQEILVGNFVMHQNEERISIVDCQLICHLVEIRPSGPVLYD